MLDAKAAPIDICNYWTGPAMPPEQTKTAENEQRKGLYLIRHWRGKLSLPVSFWLNDIALSVVMYLLTLFSAATLAARFHQQPSVAVVLIVGTFLISTCILVWSLIGFWRSARAYAGWRVWSILARVVTVAWLGLVALFWITASDKLVTTYFNCTTGRDYGEVAPFFDLGPCEVAWYAKHGLVVRRLGRGAPFGMPVPDLFE